MHNFYVYAHYKPNCTDTGTRRKYIKKSSSTGLGGSHSQFGEGVYKVLKLKTGDSVLCMFDDDIQDFSYNPTIELINPILIMTTQMMSKDQQVVQENYVLKPFLSLSNSVRYPISTDVILTLGDMKPQAKKLYLEYVKSTTTDQENAEKEHAIVDLLKELNPGRPLLFIEHETAMIVEPTDEDLEKL